MCSVCLSCFGFHLSGLATLFCSGSLLLSSLIVFLITRYPFCWRCLAWVYVFRSLFWPVLTVVMYLRGSMSTKIPGKDPILIVVDVGSCRLWYNFSCGCSGLASKEQCGSPSPLFFQDLFADYLQVRMCSALPCFWLDVTGLSLWPPILCLSRSIICLFFLFSWLW